eukprot:SAG11_NODE_33140_length_279_cov_0.572222_1_plen_59_part_01
MNGDRPPVISVISGFPDNYSCTRSIMMQIRVLQALYFYDLLPVGYQAQRYICSTGTGTR